MDNNQVEPKWLVKKRENANICLVCGDSFANR